MIIKHNVELQPYNSFRTKALAKIYCEPRSIDELMEVVRTHPDKKKLILGSGFNLFFTKDVEGLVIRPVMEQVTTLHEDDNHVDIEVEAGLEWDTFVQRCVERGYSGIENLSLIPGSVGASPIQNIGAYGTEVSETILYVKTVDLTTGDLHTYTNEECRFGYRDSIFKHREDQAIAAVAFRLNKTFEYKEKYIDLSRELNGTPNPTLRQVRDAIVNVRSRKLPDFRELPNAGSFFKNPILDKEEKERLLKAAPDAPVFTTGEDRFKTSAAFLIEKAGYKGRRSGMVGTYEHHSLVIVNHGTDSGKEIVQFMHEVQEAVQRQFGILLEPEVRIY